MPAEAGIQESDQFLYLKPINSGFQIAVWNDKNFVICDLEIVWKLEIGTWKFAKNT